MAGLKEIRMRLESAKSTRQLTSAMKMVSVSKLRKAQNRQAWVRETCFRFMEIFRNVSRHTDLSENLLFEARSAPVSKVLVIVVASEKGLCGSFNTNVCRAAEDHIRKNYAHLPVSDVHVLGIGNKAIRYFESYAGPVHSSSVIPSPSNAVYADASRLMAKVIGSFKAGSIHQVDVVYCRPVNAATQEVHIMTLLPVSNLLSSGDAVIRERELRSGSVAAARNVEMAQMNASFYHQADILPDKGSVVESMLPSVSALFFYYALCQSATAEHGARMTAMSKASDNADALIKSLNLSYNKLRQTSITNELLEIVSGSNALE